MCFRKLFVVIAAVALLVASCAHARKLAEIGRGDVTAGLSIPSDEDYEKARTELLEEICIDSLDTGNEGDVLIMNAIRDDETGDMVAVDVIQASRVVARFRNVAERFGKISLEFDITVPEQMVESKWRLRLSPMMKMTGDSIALDPVYITGQKYRDEQMRGYRRYEAFLASILTDSLDFLHLQQLEIFVRRNFPDVYAMKGDTTFVSDAEAGSIFGVSRAQVIEHYTRHGLVQRNDRKKESSERMFRKYVKDPLLSGGMRLDTVMSCADGNVVYRYVQEVLSRPGLKRIDVSLSGGLYEDGRQVCAIASPDDLAFYVSSLSTLADTIPRYVLKVIERRVYDNTYAFIDFAQGSAAIDTILSGNAGELRRVRECVAGIVAREEFELDSLRISASCSPEGKYSTNGTLARSRAEAVKGYLGQFLDKESRKLMLTGFDPENWERLDRLVSSDSLVSGKCRKIVSEAAGVAAAGGNDVGTRLDNIERELSMQPEYLYLRQKLYPKLRSVRFDFYMHRRGMQKDTVHTSEVDTVYMAGVRAIRDLDYQKAVELLRPYHDYNTALAYLSAGYNHSALADLEAMAVPSAASEYLKAVVLSRLGRKKESLESYLRSVEKDPSIVFRANLDPELSELVKLL